MPNEENTNTGETKSVCNYCGLELQPDAKVCPFCGHYKRKILNWIKLLASATALVMVLVAIAQLLFAYVTKIDTQKMLDEVEIVKSTADATLTTVEKREKQLSIRLREISSDIDSLEQAFESNKQELTSSFSNISSEIEETKATADKKVGQIVNSVNLQASKSKKRLKKIETDFNTKQDKLNLELATLKDELTAQLEKLQWRDNLMHLADEAISDSNRASYDKLLKLRLEVKDTDKYNIVNSYVLQVKRFYIGIERYGSTTFTINGKAVDLKDYTTQLLIIGLQNMEKFEVRAKAAICLHDRKEKNVPDALIRAIENDPNLYVLAMCIKSFCSITGYDNHDVLDHSELIKHWLENKDDIESKLTEPSNN